jgi:surfactin synthase thioesterase subunit
MKQIHLTQGKFALVDDEDFDWLNQWKWHYDKGYADRTVDGKHIYMHRAIMNTPDNMKTFI